MRKTTKKNIGVLLIGIMGFLSYFLVLYLVVFPLWKYGTAFVYFGPTTVIKDRIHVKKTQIDAHVFSNGEAKPHNVFSKTFRVFRDILSVIVVCYILHLQLIFVFYILGVDIMKLALTGEWRRGKTMYKQGVLSLSSCAKKVRREGGE